MVHPRLETDQIVKLKSSELAHRPYSSIYSVHKSVRYRITDVVVSTLILSRAVNK